MAGRGDQKKGPQHGLADAWDTVAEEYKNNGGGQQRREQQRMREPAMAPEVAVANAEAETDDVKVGSDGADGASHEDASWRGRPREGESDAQGSNRVREDRGHSVAAIVMRKIRSLQPRAEQIRACGGACVSSTDFH
jgi:hypothetical protein